MHQRATLFSVRTPNEDVCPYCVSFIFLIKLNQTYIFGYSKEQSQ